MGCGAEPHDSIWNTDREVQLCLGHTNPKRSSAQRSTVSARECQPETDARCLRADAQKAGQGFLINWLIIDGFYDAFKEKL